MTLATVACGAGINFCLLTESDPSQDSTQVYQKFVQKFLIKLP